MLSSQCNLKAQLIHIRYLHDKETTTTALSNHKWLAIVHADRCTDMTAFWAQAVDVTNDNASFTRAPSLPNIAVICLIFVLQVEFDRSSACWFSSKLDFYPSRHSKLEHFGYELKYISCIICSFHIFWSDYWITIMTMHYSWGVLCIWIESNIDLFESNLIMKTAPKKQTFWARCSLSMHVMTVCSIKISITWNRLFSNKTILLWNIFAGPTE